MPDQTYGSYHSEPILLTPRALDQCTETHRPMYPRFTQTPPVPITVKVYMTGAQFALSGGVVPLPAEILSFPRLDSHGAY